MAVKPHLAFPPPYGCCSNTATRHKRQWPSAGILARHGGQPRGCPDTKDCGLPANQPHRHRLDTCGMPSFRTGRSALRYGPFGAAKRAVLQHQKPFGATRWQAATCAEGPRSLQKPAPTFATDGNRSFVFPPEHREVYVALRVLPQVDHERVGALDSGV